jgi:hypothetical protein
MSLHPDERPATIQDFHEALLGRRNIPSQPIPGRPAFDFTDFSRLMTPIEAIVGYTAIGLFLLGLIVTLAR